MRESIVEVLKCPGCGGEGCFRVEAAARDAREIREGRLACERCGRTYEIRAGVADLLAGGAIRAEVAREAAGWTRSTGQWFDLTGRRDNFWTQAPANAETAGISADEFILRLPDFERIGRSFLQREGYKTESWRELMRLVHLWEGDKVLELGAARCWAMREFARAGCHCVATDIVTTKYVGLESSDVYFEAEPGLYWERVRCDMESLPFARGAFDTVFCNAVLHHSRQVPRVLEEAWRVLAPGGRLLIVNEPDYGLLNRGRNRRALAREAAETGANENLYNQRYFVRELERIGFRTIFRPCRWLAKYYAWRVFRCVKWLGLPLAVQDWIEARILAHEPWARRLVGLGTMGIAEKPLDRD